MPDRRCQPTGARRPVRGWSRQTALEPGEFLVAVEVPAVPAGTGMAHVRMKMHERPAVTVAARIRLTRDAVPDARLVVGSVDVVRVYVKVAGALAGAGPRQRRSQPQLRSQRKKT